jgi:hypothetical protein
VTQFWMFSGSRPAFEAELGVNVISCEENRFLSSLSSILFPDEPVWTVVDTQTGIADSLFVEAQAQLEDVPLGETRLGHILTASVGVCDRIAFGYGDDVQALDVVHNASELMQAVTDAISHAQCEVYLRFDPSAHQTQPYPPSNL